MQSLAKVIFSLARAMAFLMVRKSYVLLPGTLGTQMLWSVSRPDTPLLSNRFTVWWQSNLAVNSLSIELVNL